MVDNRLFIYIWSTKLWENLNDGYVRLLGVILDELMSIGKTLKIVWTWLVFRPKGIPGWKFNITIPDIFDGEALQK